MEDNLKTEFLRLWRKYFNNASLPITFYYTDEPDRAPLATPGALPRCVIEALVPVREGASYAFSTESVGCFGGRKYLGFADTISPNFDYFLSCGIPGKVRGERYKKSPELVRESMKIMPQFQAPARYAVFKRWDLLEKADTPEVVIFFATADVLAGLFTLANFDEVEPDGVAAPFGSGCSSIVQYPYLEKDATRPRAFIGLFDVSARPYVKPDTLTLAMPVSKFTRMVANMEESFLITDSWKKIQRRIP